MVQWLADSTVHAQRSRDVLPPKRPARRGYSVTDFQGDMVPEFLAGLQAAAAAAAAASSSSSSSSSMNGAPQLSSASIAHVPTEASIPENAVLRTTPQPTTPSSPSPPSSSGTQHALTSSLRPRQQLTKKPPRRSYSATDKEPEDAALAPDQARPSARMCLLDLPPEMHYTLFDFLDPIDAVCLGLAHPKLYHVHRRMHAKVPLSSRYDGPNDLEWVWRGVRHLNRQPQPQPQPQQQQSRAIDEYAAAAAAAAAVTNNGLERLRVKGQVYCRKCGISRCELHRHLKGWMGEGYEYCTIKERFGAPAPEGAKPYCFMSSPKDRHRCGRHGALKSSRPLDSGGACNDRAAIPA